MMFETTIKEASDSRWWWFSIVFAGEGPHYGIHFPSEEKAREYKEEFLLSVARGKNLSRNDVMSLFSNPSF